jgi:YgiT-type zinc finger domain-containing protein
MNCIYCQGIMKKGTAPLNIDRKECHVTLDNIPAWICGQCGEAYFEENEVSAVQDLINVIDQKA